MPPRSSRPNPPHRGGPPLKGGTERKPNRETPSDSGGVALLILLVTGLGYWLLRSDGGSGAVGMIGSACKVAPASVDCALERLPWGNIIFNAPPTMRLDSVYGIALRLSPKLPVDTALFRSLVGDSGATVGTARVRFTKRMSASLRGIGFEVEPPPAELRLLAVSETAPTDWSWQVTPQRTGKLLLTAPWMPT